jgi:hypothetical protein
MPFRPDWTVKKCKNDSAYTPLLNMTQRLYANDIKASRALLIALAKVNPKRPEATLLLDRLFNAADMDANRL